MNDKIEVGEYVRTDDGIIFKVDYLGQSIVIDRTDKYTYSQRNIAKHSKNLIDLIEVGDFVNGYPVRKISNFNNKLCNFDLNNMQFIPLEEIDVWEDVLTKEQYEKNCFRVGE